MKSKFEKRLEFYPEYEESNIPTICIDLVNLVRSGQGHNKKNR